MPEERKLFENFPPVTTGEWTEKIKADLKGEDFEKLVRISPEGLRIMPFYRQEDIEGLTAINTLPGESPWLRSGKSSGNNWLIRQDIKVADYREANRKALDVLMKGVDSIGFEIDNPDSLSPESIGKLLDGIHPESIEINFRSEGKARELLAYFIGVINSRKTKHEEIRGAFEADPLGRLFMNGKLCIPSEDGFVYLAALTKEASVLPSFRVIQVNGHWLANAGADPVKELAIALAMGNEYLSILTGRGISADLAASKMRFSFATGPDYFLEIARLRAARLLWSLVTEAYKPENEANTRMEIHSVTGEWNKRVTDPYVNMLRTQTEAMSAVLGGADSLTVNPFDKTFRVPDDFSERIARNQQLLLREEAYFSKVSDPAGGSWYIEKLSSMVADEAWKTFLKIESDGGFLAALEKGYIKSLVDEGSAKREAFLAMTDSLYQKGKRRDQE